MNITERVELYDTLKASYKEARRNGEEENKEVFLKQIKELRNLKLTRK